MIYELINPSDKVTFEGSDDMVAAISALLLGRGKYGLDSAVGEPVLPVFLLGGCTDWLAENGVNLDQFIPRNAAGMADFLGTAFYGSAEKRADYAEAVKRMTPEAAAEYRAWYDDKHRTSMKKPSGGITLTPRGLSRSTCNTIYFDNTLPRRIGQ
jgi:hypothetical protein